MVTVDAKSDLPVETVEKTVEKTKQKPTRPPIEFNDYQIILSILAAVVIGFAIYNIPSYYFLEHITRNLVLDVIQILGVNATKSDPFGSPGYAPGIKIWFNDTQTSWGDYWIVRACTGMQAGAILVALIVVTDAPVKNKTIAVPSVLGMLFVANVLRIAFHMLLVSWGIPFFWAHDVLSKPIGFVGTLIFAMVIEKEGVPIIDTFADWMDWTLQKLDKYI